MSHWKTTAAGAQAVCSSMRLASIPDMALHWGRTAPAACLDVLQDHGTQACLDVGGLVAHRHAGDARQVDQRHGAARRAPGSLQAA